MRVILKREVGGLGRPGDIKDVAVTRLSRTVDAKEIEQAVASALEHRSGLGDAANCARHHRA